MVTYGSVIFVSWAAFIVVWGVGAVLAAFGAAITGSLFGIGIVVVVYPLFLSRIAKEERIMRELFPDTYPAYQMRTKKLIPFVW